MAIAARLPGMKSLHAFVHVGHGEYRCSCGEWLGVNKSAACAAIHVHRDQVPLDEWLANFVDADGDCWLWLGRLDDAGYGRAGASMQAHRLVYRGLVGEIPQDLTIDHRCQVKRCVNPDHLEPVPRGINTLRGYGPSGRNSRKTECSNGHPFTPENTYVERKTGKRHCQTCFDLRPRKTARRVRAERRVRLGEHEGDE